MIQENYKLIAGLEEDQQEDSITIKKEIVQTDQMPQTEPITIKKEFVQTGQMPQTTQLQQSPFVPNNRFWVKNPTKLQTLKKNSPPAGQIVNQRGFSCVNCSIVFANEIAMKHHLRFVHKLQCHEDMKSGNNFQIRWKSKEALIQKNDKKVVKIIDERL
jgi:hypothetical protein